MILLKLWVNGNMGSSRQMAEADEHTQEKLCLAAASPHKAFRPVKYTLFFHVMQPVFSQTYEFFSLKSRPSEAAPMQK